MKKAKLDDTAARDLVTAAPSAFFDGSMSDDDAPSDDETYYTDETYSDDDDDYDDMEDECDDHECEHCAAQRRDFEIAMTFVMMKLDAEGVKIDEAKMPEFVAFAMHEFKRGNLGNIFSIIDSPAFFDEALKGRKGGGGSSHSYSEGSYKASAANRLSKRGGVTIKSSNGKNNKDQWVTLSVKQQEEANKKAEAAAEALFKMEEEEEDRKKNKDSKKKKKKKDKKQKEATVTSDNVEGDGPTDQQKPIKTGKESGGKKGAKSTPTASASSSSSISTNKTTGKGKKGKESVKEAAVDASGSKYTGLFSAIDSGSESGSDSGEDHGGSSSPNGKKGKAGASGAASVEGSGSGSKQQEVLVRKARALTMSLHSMDRRLEEINRKQEALHSAGPAPYKLSQQIQKVVSYLDNLNSSTCLPDRALQAINKAAEQRRLQVLATADAEAGRMEAMMHERMENFVASLASGGPEAIPPSSRSGSVSGGSSSGAGTPPDSSLGMHLPGSDVPMDGFGAMGGVLYQGGSGGDPTVPSLPPAPSAAFDTDEDRADGELWGTSLSFLESPDRHSGDNISVSSDPALSSSAATEADTKRKGHYSADNVAVPPFFPLALKENSGTDPTKQVSYRIGVPKMAVGLILGKGEARLKALCANTGSKVTLMDEQRSQQGEFANMLVSGTVLSVRNVCLILYQILSAKSYTLKFA